MIRGDSSSFSPDWSRARASIWITLPKPPLLEDVSFSRRVFDRNGQLLRVTLSEDGKYRIFTPLDQISPELIRATLAQEDRFFWRHAGVNPIALARAAGHFSLGNNGRGGASTITMQLARLRFHIHSRTVRGKLAQDLARPRARSPLQQEAAPRSVSQSRSLRRQHRRHRRGE